MVQICITALDVLTFEEEPKHKSNFVRLIGSHSAKFIILVFTGLVCVNAMLDGISFGLINLVILSYAIFVLWMLNRFMEERKDNL